MAEFGSLEACPCTRQQPSFAAFTGAYGRSRGMVLLDQSWLAGLRVAPCGFRRPSSSCIFGASRSASPHCGSLDRSVGTGHGCLRGFNQLVFLLPTSPREVVLAHLRLMGHVLLPDGSTARLTLNGDQVPQDDLDLPIFQHADQHPGRGRLRQFVALRRGEISSGSDCRLAESFFRDEQPFQIKSKTRLLIWKASPFDWPHPNTPTSLLASTNP